MTTEQTKKIADLWQELGKEVDLRLCVVSKGATVIERRMAIVEVFPLVGAGHRTGVPRAGRYLQSQPPFSNPGSDVGQSRAPVVLSVMV